MGRQGNMGCQTTVPALALQVAFSYGVIFAGQLRAWGLPYLFHPEAKRAARYQIMFGKHTASCQFATDLSPMRHMSSFIWRPPPL
jgi:hypothetical protein